MTIVQGAKAIDGNAAAWEARDTGLRSEGARLRLGWMSWLCVAWLVGLAAAAATAGLLPLSDPLATDIANRVAAPSVKFWLGTDQLGRDMLARVVYGARVSLSVAFCTALIAAVFGMLLGLPAGYFRGRTEVFLMGAADVGLAFPAYHPDPAGCRLRRRQPRQPHSCPRHPCGSPFTCGLRGQ